VVLRPVMRCVQYLMLLVVTRLKPSGWRLYPSILVSFTNAS